MCIKRVSFELLFFTFSVVLLPVMRFDSQLRAFSEATMKEQFANSMWHKRRSKALFGTLHCFRIG